MRCDDPIPQALVVVGKPHGTPPPCIGCRESIDTADEYWVLLDGPPGGRPAALAAAHTHRWDDALGDYDSRCTDALWRDWEQVVAGAGARVLRLGEDGGGPRFFAGAVPIHAGTPIEVLGADGWLTGRFEYETRTHPWQPLVYLCLGGWDFPSARLVLPADAVVRLPDR